MRVINLLGDFISYIFLVFFILLILYGIANWLLSWAGFVFGLFFAPFVLMLDRLV